MRHRSTKLFVLTAFAITIATLISFIFLTYSELNKTIRQSKEEKQLLNTKFHLDNLQIYLTNIESLERPNLIAAQPNKFLLKFDVLEKNCVKEIDDLLDNRTLLNDDLLKLKTITAKRLVYTRILITKSAAGNVKEGSDLLENEYEFDNPVDNQIYQIEESISTLQKSFNEENKANAKNLLVIFCMATIFVFIIIGVSFYKIWKNVDTDNENKFLQNLVEHLPGIFYMYNRNGEFKMWNENFEMLTGFSASEIKKMHPVDFYENEVEKNNIRNRMKKVFNGNAPKQVEVELFSKDKRRIPFMINSWMINYNGEQSLVGVGIDLRELKEKQAIIHKEKDFLEKLVNNLPGVFLMFNSKGEILKCNNNIQSLLGYSFDEMKQINVNDIIPAEDKELLKNRIAKAIDENNLLTREGNLLSKSKEKILMNIFTWSVDYKNEPVLVTLGFDLRETKKKQLLLNKFNAIVSHANTFAAITDIKTRKTFFMNNAFRKALEVNQDEEINIHEFHNDEEHQQFKDQIMPEIFKHGIWNGKYSFRSKSNKKIPVIAEWILHKDEDGNAKEISVTAIDITKLKEKESEINNLAEIIGTTQALVFIIDFNFKILYLNKSAKEKFGVSEDEDISQLSGLDFVPDETKKLRVIEEPKLLRDGKWVGEIKYINRSGEIFPTLEVAVVHKDEAGIPKYISLTLIDITEQKKKENEITKLSNELRHLSLHLQNVIEEERAMMAKEIHDEFGQNLVALSMNAAWLKANLKDKNKKTEDVIDEQVKISVDAIQKSRSLFNSLRPYMLDEIGLVAAIRWNAQTFLKYANIKIDIHSNMEDEKFPKEISLCLYRIFQESLNNIIRHSEATKISIEIFKNDQMIEMNIEDNGIGFDSTNVNILNSHGLLGIRERVYAQSGKYLLNSELGKGTRIQIQIPLSSTDKNIFDQELLK